MLGVDALLAPAEPRIGAPFFELFENLPHGPLPFTSLS
jgi:hypothetical protein